jgi:hypothetical protein
MAAVGRTTFMIFHGVGSLSPAEQQKVRVVAISRVIKTDSVHGHMMIAPAAAIT